jgi:anti-sigma B factor antagonist
LVEPGGTVHTPANSETPAGQQIQIDSGSPADGVVVLNVAGEVDLLTATALGERIREHLVPGTRVLILDLGKVSFLGSAGLAEIVAAGQAGATTVVLVATNRAVLRPLDVTGLLSLFTVYDTVDAAVADAAG